VRDYLRNIPGLSDATRNQMLTRIKKGDASMDYPEGIPWYARGRLQKDIPGATRGWNGRQTVNTGD
jgi:hypothetical protein